MPRMKVILVVLVLVLALVLAQRMAFSFMAQRPADYAETTPAFDLERHLSGALLADGVLYGPTGRVNTRFTAEMQGAWEGGRGRLAEDFRYSTGWEQHREWRIEKLDATRFTATADDVIGVASGQISGSTLLMRYRLQLPERSGGWQLDVTDWLYLGEDGVIVNRSQFRRFGVKLGELVGTIRPRGE
jgi:hypothetical protein